MLLVQDLMIGRSPGSSRDRFQNGQPDSPLRGREVARACVLSYLWRFSRRIRGEKREKERARATTGVRAALERTGCSSPPDRGADLLAPSMVV